MDISTVISGDPCSEKLLPTGSAEILIQRWSGDVYGVGPRNYVWGGMVFRGALREVVGMKGTLCQCRGRAAGRLQCVWMWVDGSVGTCRKLWGCHGLGKQEVRLLQHGGRI